MRAWAMLLWGFLGGCAPSLIDQPWLISSPRVVAVTIDPPEAAAGAHLQLQAVVAAPDGPVSAPVVRWTSCEAPRAFSQNESINPGCIEALSTAPLGAALTEVSLAPDVCARFGPDAAGDGIRPRDTDATGGSYQPIGVQLDQAASFAFVRLSCRPASVSFEVAQAYALAARPNTNPDFTLLASIGGSPVDFANLVVGAEVELLADWSGSPEESYALIDPGTSELTTQVEHYDVSWFVTDGVMRQARDSSGHGRWQLPAEGGQGTLWAVLRDSRGGVTVRFVPAQWR